MCTKKTRKKNWFRFIYCSSSSSSWVCFSDPWSFPPILRRSLINSDRFVRLPLVFRSKSNSKIKFKKKTSLFNVQLPNSAAVFLRSPSTVSVSSSAHSRTNRRPYKWVLWQSASNAFYNQIIELVSCVSLCLTNLSIIFTNKINETKASMVFVIDFLRHTNEFQFTEHTK